MGGGGLGVGDGDAGDFGEGFLEEVRNCALLVSVRLGNCLAFAHKMGWIWVAFFFVVFITR